MSTAEASVRERGLFQDGKLRCPHDKKLRDVLSYKVLGVSPEFSAQLNPVLRCNDCGHLFSPALEPAEAALMTESLNV